RQVSEDRAQLADALRSFFADEPALDHLHLRAMRHRHRSSPSSQICGKVRETETRLSSRPVPPLPWTLVVGSGGSAVLRAADCAPATHGARVTASVYRLPAPGVLARHASPLAWCVDRRHDGRSSGVT